MVTDTQAKRFLALTEIAEERERQIAKGYTPEADAGQQAGALAAGGSAYAVWASWQQEGWLGPGDIMRPVYWPFPAGTWSPETTPRDNLIKAAAMIVAEIERLDTAAGEGGA